MSFAAASTSTRLSVGRPAGRQISARGRANRATAPIAARAQQQNHQAEPSTRRTALGLSLLSAAALTIPAAPASAFLGIGDQAALERYNKETQNIIDKTNYMISLARDDPAKADAVREVRSLTNEWVARYRRDDRFGGKPSYSNMYSVLNAISGHYNSFGPEAPIPKKRLDRINKELGDAERLLARGR